MRCFIFFHKFISGLFDMMKRFTAFVLLSALTCGLITADACTTFIISGKFTPDGRPVLYKHRDTGTLDNALAFFNDGRYPYIALVNGNEKWNLEVWGGFNAAGFAIMNSVAYNMNVGDTTTFADQEGEIMKMALMTCATIDDFERMLNDLPKPLGVDSNFGVIDAYGGAAYFETGNWAFNKINVNDPAVAPFGYVIRTNHAFTGSPEKGYGYIRYATAEKVLNDVIAGGHFNPDYLLSSISRNLTHSLTGDDLSVNPPENAKEPDYRFFEDYIPRASSASVMMVKGSGEGEDPLHTMMWTILGFPLTSVALPAWITSDGFLPAIAKAGDDFHAPICDAALLLKRSCFPITRGSGMKYIDLSRVLNQEGTGIMQLLGKVEDEIFRRVREKNLPAGECRDTAMKDFYAWLDRFLENQYQVLFGINLFESIHKNQQL